MPNEIELYKELGALRAEVDTLKMNMDETKKDIKQILGIVLKAEGGLKTLIAIGSAGGVLGSIFTYIGTKLFN